jgi:streptogramin lyase
MLKSKILMTTALLAAALAPGVASAAPHVDGEFPVSEQPKRLALGPDGNIWVTIGGKIAKISPAGDVTEYDPAEVGSPNGIVAGPDGNLWLTQSGEVVKVPPAAPLTATKFTIAEISDPRAITVGPDGNLWTASGDQVVKIPPGDPATRTAYTVTGLAARDIASGGDGQLWVADFGDDRVVSLTTGGVSKSYPVGGGVQGIAAGPGTQIAYANPSSNPQQVGRIEPGGEAQKTDVPGTDPFGVTFGPDGAYWFAEFNGSKVGRMTVDGKVSALDGLSAGSGPRYITAGPGNTLWVSLEQSNKVARISGVEAPPAEPAPPAGSGDRVAPAIRELAFSPTAFRAGHRVKLRFRLSEDASVRLVFERLRNGHRSRRVGTLRRRGVKGLNRMPFRGRIGRKRLAPGLYRVTATAKDIAGNGSRPKRAKFRIV